MEHPIIKLFGMVAVMGILLTLPSCYNDSYSNLYPQNGNCDTTHVTYSQEVWPVISANCSGCHGGSTPAGNISLSKYSEIVTSVNKGRFLGSIRHDQGYSPMPKGGGRLDACTLKHIEIWINDGMPEN